MADMLVERDGLLFVLAESADHFEPKLYFAFYPTGIKASVARRNYGKIDGVALRDLGSGAFQVDDPNFPALTVRLIEGGRTVPEFFHEVAAPLPKVRRGVETRWHHGRWEKLLKREGWVLA